ncbi:MAG: 4-hydroxythreonine-4-phosphate dehydrogenase PdxA, partial [Paracoccaceae bacterium]
MGAGTTGPIALSCGEPAGIGPEIAAKAWHALRGAVPFFVIGDADHFNGHGAPVVKISQASAASAAFGGGLPVLHRDFGPARVAGRSQAAHAQGVIDAIAEAVELAQSGAARAICTLPIHKRALQQGADFAYPGHTEYLAALAGGAKVVMMLACAELRVVPATIHIPLSAVPAAFTPALLRDVSCLTSDA